MISNIELEVGGLFSEDCCPRIEASNLLPFKLIRTQILEQQVKFSKRVTDCCTTEKSSSEVFAGTLLNCAYRIQQIECPLATLAVAQTRHTVMSGVEHKVLELV